MRLYIYLLGFVFISFSAHAQSAQEILFSSRELEAAFILTRPELSSIEISGKAGKIIPAPSFRYLGLEESKFDIETNLIANILDLKFNQIKSKPFLVSFEDTGIRIEIPLNDQSKAVQCNVGSISFKGVSLVGVFYAKRNPNGSQLLLLKQIQLNGQIKGTGVLRSDLILKKTREVLVKALTDKVNEMIQKNEIQESIQNGLLTWSKFYTGNDYRSLVPGSMQLDRQGIRYQAQY